MTKAIKRARYLALLPYAPQHERVTGPVKIFEIDEKPSEEPEVKDSKVVAADEDNSNSSDDQVTEQENSTSDDTQTS